MITLSNGYSFVVAAASGALAFDGDGWPWEQPLRWMGILDPKEFTIILKTITRYPRKGNLKWWCPWRCVRLIKGGAVNSVGLTNPGLVRWIAESYPKVKKRGYNAIVSIAPETPEDAIAMISSIKSCCPTIKGIELNASCPNTKEKSSEETILEMVNRMKQIAPDLPIIVKLGVLTEYDLWSILEKLDGEVDAVDLINTVPWDAVFPVSHSPLRKYNLEGGVSGESIKEEARFALLTAKRLLKKTQILSGGGMMSEKEAQTRLKMGADAVAFGTLFLRRPWEVTRIAKNLNRYEQPPSHSSS